MDEFDLEDEEEWCVIDEAPSYLISSLGRIYSLLTDRVLKPGPDGGGYLQVALRVNGQTIVRKVHRLVGKAFLLPPHEDEYGLEINHADGNKINNRYENLEWMTSSQNKKHAFRLGLNRPPRMRSIREIYSGEVFNSIANAARELDLSQVAISNVLSGKYSQTHGYSFEYIEVH